MVQQYIELLDSPHFCFISFSAEDGGCAVLPAFLVARNFMIRAEIRLGTGLPAGYTELSFRYWIVHQRPSLRYKESCLCCSGAFLPLFCYFFIIFFIMYLTNSPEPLSAIWPYPPLLRTLLNITDIFIAV